MPGDHIVLPDSYALVRVIHGRKRVKLVQDVAYAYKELHALLGDLVAAWPAGPASDVLGAARHYLRRHCCACGTLLDQATAETSMCETCLRWPYGVPADDVAVERRDAQAHGDVPF